MKISDSIQGVEFGLGRNGTVSSIRSTFNVNVSPYIKSERNKYASGIHEATGSNVEEDLGKSGFEKISDLIVLSDISQPFDVASKIKSKSAIDESAMRLTVEAEENEVLVAIEYDPETLAILDWYQPIATITMDRNFIQPLIKGLENPSISNKRQVVFDIPLYTSYSNDLDMYQGISKSKSLGGVFGKVLQIFSIKNLRKFARRVSAKIWRPIAVRLDKFLVKKERLLLLKANGGSIPLSLKKKNNMTGKRALLFVHGIISSTNGAFGDVQLDGEFYSKLLDKYDNNLIAFDHWTLSKSIIENAKNLVDSLPKNLELDIVCHSRGAGVVRSLLELPEIMKRIKAKNINVDKVCFVAGACEGSELASEGALNRFVSVLNKMSILLGKEPIVTGLVAEVIKLAVGGLQELPGTESMDPKGKYIERLTKSASTEANTYLYCRANFDSGNRLVSAMDEYTIDRVIFKDKANDVVVPFYGAGKSNRYLENKVIKKNILDLGSSRITQSNVWHTTFFSNDSVKQSLLKALL